jgi:hypothetical protein
MNFDFVETDEGDILLENCYDNNFGNAPSYG